ncbi:hypothetical protein MIR68_005910 [Amoeboaphelidium protococcarum]|nr:hypothetical protein MIR68_005910 [Amoeboaphelidium protococcarum]
MRLQHSPDKHQRQIIKRSQKPGHVFTFGSGVGGELGLSAVLNERRKPGNVKLLNDKYIVDVECGGQHTLALDIDGNVYSWGINDQGALGRITHEEVIEESDDEDSSDDDEGEKPLKGTEAWAPLKVVIKDDDGLDVKVVQMVCADSFCAVLSDAGEVYAWGSFRDPSGILGFNKLMERKSQNLPIKLRAFGKETVVALGSGENHIFAITSDDTLWAFGANDEYQLGRRVSSRFKNNLDPYEIKGFGKRQSILHQIVKITGGAYHTMYVSSNGELYAFGCNNCGQLGLGDLLSHLNGPERVQYAIAADGKTRIDLPPIIDIAAGESHSVAVSADGRLFTWGANLEGQLGYEADRPVFGDERDTELETSLAMNGAADSNLTLQQQGNQTADNTASYKQKYQPYPREVPQVVFDDQHGLPPLNEDKVVGVDAQSRFTIAYTGGGSLYTFGSGHSYQLGNEEMEDETVPFKVQLKGRRVITARCGGQFTMFLLEPKDQSSKPPSNQNKQIPALAQINGSLDAQQQQMQDSNVQDYRLSKVAIPTSVPVSPALNRLPIAPSSPKRVLDMMEVDHGFKAGDGQQRRGRSHQQSSSPLDAAKVLRQTFENVCVSPERKRPRADGNGDGVAHGPDGSILKSPSTYSRDEKMAPWSPNRKDSPGLFNAPAGAGASSTAQNSSKRTLHERLNKVKKQQSAAESTAGTRMSSRK